MAEHATPEELEKAGPAVKEMAGSMSKQQLHEFAATKEKGLPEHVHHKKHRGDGRHSGRHARARGESVNK